MAKHNLAEHNLAISYARRAILPLNISRAVVAMVPLEELILDQAALQV